MSVHIEDVERLVVAVMDMQRHRRRPGRQPLLKYAEVSRARFDLGWSATAQEWPSTASREDGHGQSPDATAGLDAIPMSTYCPGRRRGNNRRPRSRSISGPGADEHGQGSVPLGRDCCQYCCQATGQHRSRADNCGISAQRTDRNGRSWTTCLSLRIRRLGVSSPLRTRPGQRPLTSSGRGTLCSRGAPRGATRTRAGRGRRRQRLDRRRQAVYRGGNGLDRLYLSLNPVRLADLVAHRLSSVCVGEHLVSSGQVVIG